MSSKGSSKSSSASNGKRGNFRRDKSFKSSKSHTNYKSSKSKEYKFTPLDSRYQAPQATYVSVLEHLETEITRDFEKCAREVAESLMDEKKFHIPRPALKRSQATDPDERARENDEFDFDFKDEKKRYSYKVQNLEDGLVKAYGLIWSDYMSASMRDRIEQHPEFASKIKGDAIELLKAIKVSMHETTRSQKPMLSAIQAMIKLCTYKQADNQSLSEYLKSFKEHRDVFKTQLGDIMFNYFIEQQPGYDGLSDNEKEDLKNSTFDEGMGVLFLHHSDKKKYGSISQDLAAAYARNRDEYPTTLTNAIDMLDTHRFDPAYKEHRKSNSGEGRNDRNSKSGQSFAQKTGGPVVCFCCGKKGHKSNECTWEKKVPKAEWFHKTNKTPAQVEAGKTRAVSHAQADSEDESAGGETTDEDDDSVASSRSTRGSRSTSRSSNRRSGRSRSRARTQGWSAFMVNAKQFHQAGRDDLRDVFILDTGSTIGATIMNPDLLTGLRRSKKTLRMSTNAGTKEMNLVGDVIGFGEAWYDPEMLTNIFSFSKMADKYRVVYDSAKEDAILVHTEDGLIKFERTNEGLYAYKPTAKYKSQVAKTKNPVVHAQTLEEAQHHVSTVKENMVGFTKREVDGAKLARKIYHTLGCPTLESFKHALRTNLVKNCPVTTQDAINAEKIFGPDVAAIKGKTTRKPPPVARDDYIEIPEEITNRDDFTLCIDIAFLWGLPVLTAVDKTIRYRHAVPLENRTTKELYEALDEVLRLYNDAGYNIQHIHCDREFRHMMDAVADGLNVHMNYTNTDDHVPEAERNNRTIKERFRATVNGLPFKTMPKAMIRKLVQLCVKQLNMFPAKGGVSPYLSPYTIITGKAVDYEKDLKVPFGTSVQATKESKPYNTPEPRTIDGICLGPTTNMQGGYEILALPTGRVITRARVIEVPMTDLVIQKIEALADEQGIKPLKLHYREGTPDDWIAGVDSDSDSSDSESSDSNSDSDSESDDDDDDSVPSLYRPSDDIDSDSDDEEDMDRVDRQEVDDLLAEQGNWDREESNPIIGDAEAEPEAEPGGQVDEHPAGVSVSDGDSQGTEARRSTRERHEPQRFDPSKGMNQVEATKSVKFDYNDIKHDLEQCHNLMEDKSGHKDTIEYTPEIAGVAARYIHEINESAMLQGVNLGQQHILQKGLKVFGDKGREAGRKEIGQLHERECFDPILVSELSDKEKKKALEALMFLTEKRDGSIKGRMVANGKPTREWHTREEATSPTASLEGIFLTATIDAKEKRDVMTADIPNAFIQASIPATKAGEERVIMKLTGALLDLLVQEAPSVYGPYVVIENGRRVLYLRVLKALYGMLVAALLWYRKFREDLESQGFVFNPYDPCVANRWVSHKKHTVRFHVDDLMSSHVDAKVNDKFLEWLNKLYGTHGEVKATRGKVHDYLGMTFTFRDDGKVDISMADYIHKLLDEFPTKITSTAQTPAAEDLFALGDGPELDEKTAKFFHTWVAKVLFACKRARPDTHTAVTLLCTRVKGPNQNDWKKLNRLLQYLNGTRDDVLTLGIDDLNVIKWYVDASFAVHPDFKSHTGACVTFGTRAAISMSRKQKLNTRSSTEAELVAVDDAMNLILWTKLFLEEQGYKIRDNILYQDNQSAILLEKNGKKSSSKRTRAINIRYFFVTDQTEKGNVRVEYCPTGEMTADYMTKPLQGVAFEKFRALIMGR